MASAFKDKFVAFIDVLGFKNMIESSQAGTGRSIDEIRDILSILKHEKNRDFYRNDGPQICPSSAYQSRDLDFEITQVSDSMVASCEVSPAGIINLLHHCWGVALTLLSKGVLVRGYVTRGPIFHAGNELLGTGYHEAYDKAEHGGVTAFKKEADEKGTPFIEIDPTVVAYVRGSTDSCVHDMFRKLAREDGDLVAIFPFQILSHSFSLGGDYATAKVREKAKNDIIRKNIKDMKTRILEYIDPSRADSVRKVRHYIDALDAQLAMCDETDQFLDDMGQPFPRTT